MATQISTPSERYREQHVYCPNCGSSAQRWSSASVIHTECPVCDYRLIFNASAAIVLEAYYPGTFR